MKLLVIGLGSLNGDDQIGWEIVDELKKAINDNLPITVYKSKGAGIDWFSSLADGDYQCILFVDAILSTGKPGDIRKIDLDEIESALPLASCSSHNISFYDSYQLARNLGMLKVPVKFIGVEIESANALSSMSSITQGSKSLLLDEIYKLSQSEDLLE